MFLFVIKYIQTLCIMNTRKLFSFLFLSCLLLVGCTREKAFGEVYQVKIHRFDQDLYQYLSGQRSQDALQDEHKDFLDLFGEEVIGIGKSDSHEFFSGLRNYFSHDSLNKLYKDELETFKDISQLEDDLSFGFDFLLSSFDSLSVPLIYMHTSGLQQNLVVSDKVLSVSADKYLGSDYPMYKEYFYDYQRQNMHPKRLVPDLLLGFLMSSFPYAAQQGTLLDRMLYEGKLRYILSLALPYHSDPEILAYSLDQDNWSRSQEAEIWKKLVQSKHLYVRDKLTIDKYINDAPYTSPVSDKSPGKLGIWIGYQIVRSYVKEAQKVTLQELLRNTDSQEILKISKYSR